MDNFGIFKLLNSLFNFYQENKGQEKNNYENSNGEVFYQNSKSTPINPKEKNATTESRLASPPLQSKMLFTMQNHQEIVQRVTSKNMAKSKKETHPN